MTGGLSISDATSLRRVRAASARWIMAALALTAVTWLVVLAGLLAIANRVHDDVPVLLAIKLPLLSSYPELIFAGESRTEYQVDPALAAQLIGKPQGSVVNIAYDAGEPLALLAAMRREPDRFANAHVVVSVVPFLFNEGVRSAAVYPRVMRRTGDRASCPASTRVPHSKLRARPSTTCIAARTLMTASNAPNLICSPG